MSNPGSNNPTALDVGHEGTLFGQSARVVGRSALESADGYRWDEYHLKLADGTATTLVYESGIWKRYDLFDADKPLSASDAAACGVGDQVTLRGDSADVVFVGQSRVEFIEGKAPEGYRVGSEAHYFNAEAGGRLFVVSWTGEEVEFYEGQNLPRGEVENAFGLPEPSLLARILSGGSGGLDSWFDSNSRLIGTTLAVCAVLALICFQGGSPSTAEPPPPVSAPALRLPGKAQGDLSGRHYIVAGHQIDEIAEMRGTFDRHEYELVDDAGLHALLIEGLAMDAHQWYLFRPVSDPVKIRPDQAAALKHGAIFDVGGREALVQTLFQCRAIASDGDLTRGVRTGAVCYGFTAEARDEWVLARWNETEVEVLVGGIVSDKDVRQAFGPGVSK